MTPTFDSHHRWRPAVRRQRPRRDRLHSPGDLLLASDPVRAMAEMATLPAAMRLARQVQPGNGRPVLVLPGLLAGDVSTRPLRAFLRRAGYYVYGWGLGRNIGPTPRCEAGMRELVDRIADRHGEPVALLGWSLGGIFARAIASERPDDVRLVITLGTPFAMTDPSQSRAHQTYQRFAHLHTPGHTLPIRPEISGPLPVPTTSIWSRYDGVVSWHACKEQPSATAENIAVLGSHLGLGHNAAVLWAVADRLGQPTGTWAPFVPPARMRHLYPPVRGVRRLQAV